MGFASVCEMWETSWKYLSQTAAWKEVIFLRLCFLQTKVGPDTVEEGSYN